MASEKMIQYGSKRSVIRELFEYGNQRAREVGRENVFDYSLGNPAVPAPAAVQKTAIELLSSDDLMAVHGYTSAQGDAATRQAVADHLNATYGTAFTADNFYMTCGAAASLTITLKALTESPEDEVLINAPFFPEYLLFVENGGAKPVVVPAHEPDFQVNFEALAERINVHTRAVIINSPNNPSGVVYSEETIEKLADLLRTKSKEIGHSIFLSADEPYREIVFDGVTVPYVTKYYDNTIVCYSYSKSLSLPGERIGWILVPDAVTESRTVYAAVCGAGRALGFVCAPSLFQKVIAKCAGETSDLSFYRTNRDLIYNGLKKIGYECAEPSGAFYLFIRSLEPDANAFSEHAKRYNLLLVPSDDFGCTGYVRAAYCVKTDMIERSMTAFRKLYDDYRS